MALKRAIGSGKEIKRAWDKNTNLHKGVVLSTMVSPRTMLVTGGGPNWEQKRGGILVVKQRHVSKAITKSTWLIFLFVLLVLRFIPKKHYEL